MQILKKSGHAETCIGVQSKVRGEYTLRIRDAETGDIKREVGPFSNDLTLIGLDRLGTSGRVLEQGYVGTGTNSPSSSDTSMGSLRAASTARTVNRIAPVAPLWYPVTVVTFRFAAGAINGNITEVGIGWTATSASGLWSRQLILDSAGMPVTLTVLPNEILDLVYALRYYPPGITDYTGSFTLNAITYNYTARLSNAASSQVGDSALGASGPAIIQSYAAGASLGAITGSPSGTGVSGGSHSGHAYVTGTFKAATTTSYSLAQGNATGGLQAFRTSLNAPSNCFFNTTGQMLLDQPIPKTSLNTMSLTLEMSWGVYTGPL